MSRSVSIGGHWNGPLLWSDFGAARVHQQIINLITQRGQVKSIDAGSREVSVGFLSQASDIQDRCMLNFQGRERNVGWFIALQIDITRRQDLDVRLCSDWSIFSLQKHTELTQAYANFAS